GRVVAVDGAGQVLQRLQADAVALFELCQPAVAQGDAEDVGDARFLAERGAEPGRVVVAPGDADLRLTPQVVEGQVAARPAGPEVAVQHQLVDGQVADDAHGQAEQLGDAALLDQRVYEGLDVLRAPAGGRLEQQVAEEVVVVRREDAQGVPQAAAAGQD